MTCRSCWFYTLACILCLQGSTRATFLGAFPDSLTQNDIKDCNQAVDKLKADKSACEGSITAAQKEVDKDVEDLRLEQAKQEAKNVELREDIAKKEGELKVHRSEQKDLHAQLSSGIAKAAPSVLLQHHTPDSAMVDAYLKCDAAKKTHQQKLETCQAKAKAEEKRLAARKADYARLLASRQNEAPIHATRKRNLDKEIKHAKAENGRLKENIKGLNDAPSLR